jgi:hypothetical protein
VRDDIERPCIKCGVVDEVKNMVRLSGFDEEQRPGEEYEAWVHEIPAIGGISRS